MNKIQSETPGLSGIRNIGVIAHIDAGKTTLSERFLYHSGQTHRIGEIDDGTTIMDYLDEERDRGITIVAAAASFPWRSEHGGQALIHLIDTPGHIDFTAEVERSLRVSDGAVVIFSGVEGVEAQSEKVWRQSERYHLPKIAFINKLDRLGASFERTLAEMDDSFTNMKILPLQIPVGIEADIEGVVDLVEWRMLLFGGENGGEISVAPIPEAIIGRAREFRDQLLGAVADHSSEMAELYLEERDIPAAMLKAAIRAAVISHELCPVLTGSAKRNIGVQPLMDAIVDYLPSPAECPPVTGVSPKSGENIEIVPGDAAFYGLVFKVLASNAADLLYLRVYSGRLSLNDTIVNPRTGARTKVKRILRLYSKNTESIESVGAGDIVGVIGPPETLTGDTLCDPSHPVLLENISFPDPVMSIAMEPGSAKDRGRIEGGLELLRREDPTLTVKRNENTGQLILSGMGELHLEVNRKRLADEFKINARYGKPQVAFRETLKAPIEITGIFDRVIGDQELFAEVSLSLTPDAAAPGGIAVDPLVPGANNLPKSWCESAVANLEAGLRTGGNQGYALIHIRAAVTAVRGNDKTTDGAVAGAVLEAINKAIAQVGTQLMEPIMRLEITAPENCVGEISGYLQTRRAVIHGMEEAGGVKKMLCEVPLAEMFGFSKALPKMSGGRGSFSMAPYGYQPISRTDLDRLVHG